MNQIKKFAWSGLVVSLAAFVAMAMVVSTANAAITGVTPSPASVSPGGTSSILVVVDGAGSEIISYEVLSSSTASATFASNGSTLLVCTDQAACDTDVTVNEIAATLNVSSTSSSGVVNIRVEEQGTAGAFITQVNVTAAAANVAVAAAPSSIPAAGTADSTVSATVTNAAGTNVANGTTVTFVTTLGRFETDGAGACQADADNALDDGAASCITTTTSGVGSASLFGEGVSGSATVTATAGGASGNTSVLITGAAATESLTVTAPSISPGTSTTGRLTAVDAAGNAVSGVTLTNAEVTVTGPAGVSVDVSTTDTAATNDCGFEGTNSSGVCVFTIAAAAGAALGERTIEVRDVSVGTPTTAVDASANIIVSGPASDISLDADDVEVSGTTPVTVTLLDANGNPVAVGTNPTVLASAGAVGGCTTTGTNAAGQVTCTFLAPGTPQTVTLSAVSGSASGSTQVSVGGATPPPSGDGSFTGVIADSGSSLVVWNGGSNADLAAAAAAEGAISVFVTVNGEFVGYIVGAPAFVNATFTALFPEGLPAGTPVILTK